MTNHSMDKIAVAVQAMYSPKNGVLKAGEILVRWKGDNGKFLSPLSVSHEIDWAQVDLRVSSILRVSAHLYIERFPLLFVNASNETLVNEVIFKKWLTNIKYLLNKGIKIVVEITELITDETLKNRYQLLRDSGIKLALDDFGEAFSNAGRLKQYEWQYVKFEATSDQMYQNIKAILYCKNKGIEMISEKVEIGASVWFAKVMGMQLVQGYITGRPEVMHARNSSYSIDDDNQALIFPLSVDQ